jgi:integral membrane protein (TIGR01906 family)
MKPDYELIIENVLIYLAALFLFLIILLGSMSLMIFYKGFYIQEYSKLDVYSHVSSLEGLGMNDSVMMANDAVENILQYFHGNAGLKYFTPAEQSHMKDVKMLISAMDFIYYTSAVFFIIIFVILYNRLKKDLIGFIHKLSKILLYGSIASLIFLGIILLISIFAFEPFFITFHLIFFPQGNWTFGASSLLITIFPEQFFIDITLRIFVFAIAQAAVFLVIGLWLRKNVRLHRKYHG